nr:hypothetical protein [Halomonas arcis]
MKQDFYIPDYALIICFLVPIWLIFVFLGWDRSGGVNQGRSFRVTQRCSIALIKHLNSILGQVLWWMSAVIYMA